MARRPCFTPLACLRERPIAGMNVFWLWMVADMCGYASSYWMTYNQAHKLGAQVRKGEKSTIAIFYKSYTKEVEAPDTGETSEEARRVLKAYPIFNADQVENLPDRFHPAATLDLVEPEGREQELDAFFGALPAVLRHQGDEAYYEPTADRITMPPAHLFSGFDHYYATLAHELALDRPCQPFGPRSQEPFRHRCLCGRGTDRRAFQRDAGC